MLHSDVWDDGCDEDWMWYDEVNNAQMGPYTRAEMRAMLQVGIVTSGALVWHPTLAPDLAAVRDVMSVFTQNMKLQIVSPPPQSLNSPTRKIRGGSSITMAPSKACPAKARPARSHAVAPAPRQYVQTTAHVEDNDHDGDSSRGDDADNSPCTPPLPSPAELPISPFPNKQAAGWRLSGGPALLDTDGTTRVMKMPPRRPSLTALDTDNTGHHRSESSLRLLPFSRKQQQQYQKLPPPIPKKKTLSKSPLTEITTPNPNHLPSTTPPVTITSARKNHRPRHLSSLPAPSPPPTPSLSVLSSPSVPPPHTRQPPKQSPSASLRSSQLSLIKSTVVVLRLQHILTNR